MPPALLADEISGRVELLYNRVSAETEDATGISTETKSNNFVHLYNLNFFRTLYPNLRFLAGGTFEQGMSKDESDGAEVKSKVTTKNGTLDLRLGTQFMSSGIGYNRREEKSTVDGDSSLTNVRESYNASISLRPEGLPIVDTLFLRTYTYDKERVSQDNVNDFISLGLMYEPYRNLNLRYQAALSILRDRLQDLEVKQLLNTARGTYSKQFGDRVTAYTTYSFTSQETWTTTKGTGEVISQVFPFSGLSAISDIPSPVTLDLNPALIDGELTASSGINIGRNPFLAGDNSLRNIGIDFINASEVNTIFVSVDRDLPSAVSNAFSWDIYISSDNLDWTLFQTVSPATFGIFENRFEINFNNVTTRYLKVVTRPLSAAIVVPPGFDVSNIFVTEIQTLFRESAEDVENKTSQTAHVYDLNLKWRLLDKPSLFYDFYYWTSITHPADITRTVLSNALSLRHRFNSVFTGGARVALETVKDAESTSNSTVYSTSLTATPLPTLYHSLTISGRFDETEEGNSDSHSVFLNNRAELYKGLSLLLTGGISVSNSETDRRSMNTFFNSGLSATPHPAMAVNLNYSETHTRQTGGGGKDFSTFARRGDVSVSYTPFDTVYIFASVGISAEKDRDTNTLQNYVFTWSPFPDGDLQFNFAFSETLSSENDGKTRTITPSLRWYLMRRTFLDVSYSVLTDESVIQRSKTRTFSSILSITL